MRALAVSRSRRYLAVSETAEEEPALTVYELTEGPPRLRRTLTAAELPAREALALAFSPDGRHLAAATGPPEPRLVLWLWEKQRLLAAVRLEAAGGGVCQVTAAGSRRQRESQKSQNGQGWKKPQGLQIHNPLLTSSATNFPI